MGSLMSGACCFSAVLLVFFGFAPLPVLAQQGCIAGQNHKSVPSPEDLQNTSCAAWSSSACCSKDTALSITRSVNGTYLRFRWDHCTDQKPLSEKCRGHFVRDLCFYECSPNTGPWIVPEARKKKMRNNRFQNVPLCKSECDNWFEDCKEDFTCTDNWSQNFEWKEGVNVCPANAKCRPFKEVFASARYFCETVFDHSFKYADDSQPCMRLSFDGTKTNPNNMVEEWEIKAPQRAAEFRNGAATFSNGVLAALFCAVMFSV